MVVWQGITAAGTAVPIQVTEAGQVVAATNTPVPGPEGPPGPEGQPGKDGAPGANGVHWNEVNSRLIMPTNNVGISVLLPAEFGDSVTTQNKIVINSSEVSPGDDRVRLQVGEGAGTGREVALLYTTDSNYQGAGLKIQHRYTTNANATFLKCVSETSDVLVIELDGTITGPNVRLKLDPEDPANFDADTGAYTGKTLDLKATLVSLIQKVEQLEREVSSTGSVSED